MKTLGRILSTCAALQLTLCSIAAADSLPDWARERLQGSAPAEELVNGTHQLAPWLGAKNRLAHENGALSISFRVLGLPEAPFEADDAGLLARYRGGAVVLRQTANGLEDFVLWHRDAPTSVRYEVELHGVAGLRAVAGVVEYLDAAGTPLLRTTAPWVTNGQQTRAARVDVVDCAADRSPAAPWGRPTTPPGRSHCTLEVSWPPLEGALLLDPSWQPTGQMVRRRQEHAAVRLDDGRVLLTGGSDTDTAELYDPATGTFAATGGMKSSRSRHTATLLDDGRVLVAALSRDAIEGSETYNPATGSWTLANNSGGIQRDHHAARLPDGRVLAMGGDDSDTVATAVAFDPDTDSWTAVQPMLIPRDDHVAVALAEGILVAGGRRFGTEYDSAEFFRPGSGWSPVSNMPNPHGAATAVALSDGRALVVSGIDTRAASVFDPQTMSWTATSALARQRFTHEVVAFSDGSALVIGGNGDANDSTELYTPSANRFVAGPPLFDDRSNFTATLLSDDGDRATVLAAGGDRPFYALGKDTAEILTGKLLGRPCGTASDCMSGLCIDGVCCDSPCDGCQACSVAKKGHGEDGACEPVVIDTDPNDLCEEQGVASCGTSGACDGQGACTRYAAGEQCSPGMCLSDQTTFTDGLLYTCDGQGSCVEGSTSCCDRPGNCGACNQGICDPPPGPMGGSGGAGNSGGGGTGNSGGSSGGSSGTGATSQGGTGSRPQTTGTDSDSGCGCSVPARGSPEYPAWLALGFLSGLLFRRRSQG